MAKDKRPRVGARLRSSLAEVDASLTGGPPLRTRVVSTATLRTQTIRIGKRRSVLIVLLGHNGGGPIASVTLYDLNTDNPWLSMLYVNPGERRKGNARRLLAYAESECRSARKPRLQLWVARRNAAARKLYESCGFEVTDTCGTADIPMVKQLRYGKGPSREVSNAR